MMEDIACSYYKGSELLILFDNRILPECSNEACILFIFVHISLGCLELLVAELFASTRCFLPAVFCVFISLLLNCYSLNHLQLYTGRTGIYPMNLSRILVSFLT